MAAATESLDQLVIVHVQQRTATAQIVCRRTEALMHCQTLSGNSAGRWHTHNVVGNPIVIAMHEVIDACLLPAPRGRELRAMLEPIAPSVDLEALVPECFEMKDQAPQPADYSQTGQAQLRAGDLDPLERALSRGRFGAL